MAMAKEIDKTQQIQLKIPEQKIRKATKQNKAKGTDSDTGIV